MKRYKSLLGIFMLVAILLVSQIGIISDTLAQQPEFKNPLGSDRDPIETIDAFLVKVITWLLGISGGLAILAIIGGGVRMILSFGNDQSVAAAKGIITWAVLGLLVILLSYAILTIVVNEFLGVPSAT